MSLVGASPLAIPDAGDVSRAYQEQFDPPNPAVGADFERLIPGETYEQFLTGRVLFITSAAAGNRLLQVQVIDPNGRLAGQFPALNTQGPSVGGGYSIYTGFGNPYATAFSVQTIVLPPMLLVPGTRLVIDMAGVAAGDSLQSIAFSMLRIPTGTLIPEQLAVAPHPLIV